jgi:hypothetical protein
MEPSIKHFPHFPFVHLPIYYTTYPPPLLSTPPSEFETNSKSPLSSLLSACFISSQCSTHPAYRSPDQETKHAMLMAVSISPLLYPNIPYLVYIINNYNLLYAYSYYRYNNATHIGKIREILAIAL